MHSWQRTTLTAAAALVIMAAPALALGKRPPVGGSPGGGAPGSGKGAPGPVAGAGLPFLLIAGGYALVRHYRHRRTGGD